MDSEQTLSLVLARFVREMRQLLGQQFCEAILFGSCAHGQQSEGSDIDIMVLCRLEREQLGAFTDELAAIACALSLEYDVDISPLLENRTFFENHRSVLPFYRNVAEGGVRIGA